MTKWLIKKLILASQRFPQFRARGGYSGLRKVDPSKVNRFTKSEIELSSYDVFLENVDSKKFFRDIDGKRILDYGSGYGGRGVWLAERAAFVEGVEIRQPVVDISNDFAKDRGVQNIRFSLGAEESIQFDDDAFDTIVSFDVLEHVQRPDMILREMYRVAKPGGKLVLIFTPYYGMFSHHLNYITLMPALHWFFPPGKLIEAVNELLDEHPTFRNLDISRQPSPHVSYNGKRKCLPLLNGMTRSEYIKLVRETGFTVQEMRSTPVLEKFPLLGKFGAIANRVVQAMPGCNELFSHNLVSVLQKAA